MRANGHDPCVVLQTSPGHLQAWIHLSTSPLEPAVATAAGKQLARIYGGDLASTDWRHLGRLAGFTNQKPQRRTPGGYAPWVKIVHSPSGVGSQRRWIAAVRDPAASDWRTGTAPGSSRAPAPGGLRNTLPPSIAAAEATQIYQGWMKRWRIAERFPQPDWSIVDFWIARQLLSQGTPADAGPSHSPTRQPSLSSPPRRPRRLPATHSRTCCFSRPQAHCVSHSCHSLRPGRPARGTVRTPPAEDSPAPSAVAAGCRPCSGIAPSKLAPRPDHGTPAGRPPRTSASS